MSDDERIDVLGLTREDFYTATRNHLHKALDTVDELYAGIFAFRDPDELLSALSAEKAARWKTVFTVGRLRLASIQHEDGVAGRTTKFGFLTRDGYPVESVAIPMFGDSLTLCVSSQVGCARACAFCQTGKAGLVRNLSAAEIVAQVYSARMELGLPCKNIVFMGMGEPLDNFDKLRQALAVLRENRGLAYSSDRLTVCTSGVEQGLRRLGELGLKRLNVSISLNAARNELRDVLMPINRQIPLERLQAALVAYPRRRNFFFGVNYCLLPGINDTEEDARAIADFIRPIGRCLVNLIPYNPGAEPLTRAPREDEIQRFIDSLMALDVPVRRRLEKGRSLMAACGQLGESLRTQDCG